MARVGRVSLPHCRVGSGEKIFIYFYLSGDCECLFGEPVTAPPASMTGRVLQQSGYQ